MQHRYYDFNINFHKQANIMNLCRIPLLRSLSEIRDLSVTNQIAPLFCDKYFLTIIISKTSRFYIGLAVGLPVFSKISLILTHVQTVLSLQGKATSRN